MQQNNYNIPLKYNQGVYTLAEINNKSDESLSMVLEDWGGLIFTVPLYEEEVRLYSISEEIIQQTFKAYYNENGLLERMTLSEHNDDDTLIYIRFENNSEAEQAVMKQSDLCADVIVQRILTCKITFSRLFIEHFFDGEALDFCAKYGTDEDIKEIVNRYGEDTDVVDNSGDYPIDNRMETDIDILQTMLLCTDGKFKSELCSKMFDSMIHIIKDKVLEKIDKSDDFKFIAAEYD